MNCDRHDLPIVSEIGCEECEIEQHRADLRARHAIDDQPYQRPARDTATGRWSGRLLNTTEVDREAEDRADD